MAITFFGRASTPLDNGANNLSPTVVTPPTSMLAGDLVILFAVARSDTGTIAISQAGGQTWTTKTQSNQTDNRSNILWCRFNGTWSANPSVTMGSTTNNIVTMHVFRGDSTATEWEADVAMSGAAYSAATTVTIPAITTKHNNALVFAGWTASNDTTWGTLTAGWSASTDPQYRNTSQQDSVESIAYKVQATAGTTGNVTQIQSASTAGTIWIGSFYQKLIPSVVAGAISIKAVTVSLGCTIAASILSAALSISGVTVTTTKSPTITPNVQTVTATIQEPTYPIGDMTVAPNVVGAALSVIEPTIAFDKIAYPDAIGAR